MDKKTDVSVLGYVERTNDDRTSKRGKYMEVSGKSSSGSTAEKIN